VTALRIACGVGAALALAACAGSRPSEPTSPKDADLAACHAESTRRVALDTRTKRFEFVEDCMAAKGWRPTPACVETRMQGTVFCDYVRTR
jgi:hypothetical protein